MSIRSHVLITGGAGFVGINIARSYLSDGQPVHILDNLSRTGVASNVEELTSEFPGKVRFTCGDVRDRDCVREALADASAVYHLAAQVAVTTSLLEPVSDLETNLLGTVNVLEALRAQAREVPVLFTSTNKVYGKLGGIFMQRSGRRWTPAEQHMRSGVGEEHPLEFLSPYGCSKGSADQYVLDYAHSFGLPAIVFRMSCIYGPWQLGSEDQGWVAHFLRQALRGGEITIYGDGCQVRDLLYIDDLIVAMRTAVESPSVAGGNAFNIGGGAANSVSLLELLEHIAFISGMEPDVSFAEERLADQKWYVARTSKAERMLGWSPRTSVEEGVTSLCQWYRQRPSLIESLETAVPAGVA